jgi:Zn-dependent protease with chaperone function
MSDPAFTASAIWYDGESAIRREGTAHWDPAGNVILTEGGGESADPLSQGARTIVPMAALLFAEKLPDTLLYTRKDVPGFRLRLPHDLPPGLAAKLPRTATYGRFIDRIGLGPATIGFAALSAAVVALFLTAPEWLGPRIPVSWERQMGDAMVGDLGNRLCSTPEGDAALQKMLDAVDPAETQVRAGVANMDMVNAVALPGGQVLLFDGLIQQAETPAELAGVLGHEVGHVRERHVMTAMLRQFGMSILLSGADSGVGNSLFGVASLAYSRDAEREADEFARARMAESNISPLGAAAFFERIADGSIGEEPEEEGEGENSAEDASGDIEVSDGPQNDSSDSEEAVQDRGTITNWMASHPEPRERAQAYRDAAHDKEYPPALTEDEFAALKSMCEDDPDVEEFDFF